MENKTIVDELYFCAAQCMRCYNACLRENGSGKLQQCKVFSQDCAEICRLTGRLLERDSENVDKFLKLCEDICERCAEECEKYSKLEYCRDCAKACREFNEIYYKQQLTFRVIHEIY